jgi:hypothetical protein
MGGAVLLLDIGLLADPDLVRIDQPQPPPQRPYTTALLLAAGGPDRQRVRRRAQSATAIADDRTRLATNRSAGGKLGSLELSRLRTRSTAVADLFVLEATMNCLCRAAPMSLAADEYAIKSFGRRRIACL